MLAFEPVAADAEERDTRELGRQSRDDFRQCLADTLRLREALERAEGLLEQRSELPVGFRQRALERLDARGVRLGERRDRLPLGVDRLELTLSGGERRGELRLFGRRRFELLAKPL